MKIWVVSHGVCDSGESHRNFNKKPTYEMFISILKEWNAYPHHNKDRMKTWEETYNETGQVDMGSYEGAGVDEEEVIEL